MAIFDVGQNVVNRAAGVINQQTAINIDSVITSMETAMESMEDWGADYTGTGNAPGEFVPKGYIRFYNGYFIWPYDRNLSVFVNWCDSICHYEQPGMGTDWQQLFQEDCLHWHFRDFLSWCAWAFILYWLPTYRYQIMCIQHCSV